MDDDVELRRLRERVYGAGGAPATRAMLERLAELEDRSRPSTGVVDSPAPADPADEPADPDHIDEPEDTLAPTSRPVFRGVLIAAGAIALIGLGIAVGSAATASMPVAATDPVATIDPAAAMYPELTYAQTIEDAISADVLRDSAIDSGSTRYIATVSDFQIFFAQPDDGDGRCIVTFTATDNKPATVGCASGAQEGAAVFRIDDGLMVAIGNPDASLVGGIPIRLSESVTAYVAR